MTNKTLEEIFWKDGKFINSKDNEVKPEAVGNPEKILLISFSEKIDVVKVEKQFNELINSIPSLYATRPETIEESKKINAFSRGEKFGVGGYNGSSTNIIYPIQFYKI